MEAIHSPAYLDELESTCAAGGGWIDPDTYLGPESYEAALGAAGACLEAVDRAMDGERPFCLVRPPGHHAESDRGMGFCLINNAAAAARRALERGLRPVAVVDIDVHHGNGTQQIFFGNPDVLYISLHQWPWYPWRGGGLEQIGEGDGRGANVNIPLPAGSGDGTYLEALSRIVVPVLGRFRPAISVVSLGFDAHIDDPLSLMELSSRGYGALLRGIVAASGAGGRVVATLEGGYNLDALAECFIWALRALAGEEVLPEDGGSASTSQAVERAASFHSRIWDLA